MIVIMAAFAFLLVPLYNVFCDVTGLNGKLDLSIAAATSKGIDSSREVTVEFVVNQNREMPWQFKPKHSSLTLHPGQLAATAYFAKNVTNKTMYAQAIPSISPSRASKFFKKVECFCFTNQKLGPGETAYLGLRFYLDPDLPKDIKRITLAYTIFDITETK
jgi:cytochrome c oxidase assembly protein subunit 11